MLRIGFEPSILVFEMAKTVQSLDRAVILIEYLTTYYGEVNHRRAQYMFGLDKARMKQSTWNCSIKM
jgi:hypothetical protein